MWTFILKDLKKITNQEEIFSDHFFENYKGWNTRYK